MSNVNAPKGFILVTQIAEDAMSAPCLIPVSKICGVQDVTGIDQLSIPAGAKSVFMMDVENAAPCFITEDLNTVAILIGKAL